MPPISMTPGTVLGGRYRLEDLLSEQDGARFWRATDTVLERSVAVHAVASTDPRAAAVLDAAQRSAGVSEPHFLRVLDCDDVDGITWVINEWGDGVSLDVMLARGTLPPMRAAWLTREVAEAIAAAHAQGVHHGRLNPEAVLVTASGSVRIIGFVVNAAFERSAAAVSPYGPIGAREADVVDLAGILYAALTGRWPGIAPSSVPPAPRDGNRPLRPRQVRAGVPRTLDAICDRVLHKEASAHSMPIETAYEVAAALSDFVGDPAAVAPADLPSMHADPEPPPEPDIDSYLLDPDPTPETAPAPNSEPAPAAVVDPDATMASAPPYEAVGIEFLEPEVWAPAAPPPPFEQPTDRPLFAETERRVPADAPVAPPVAEPPPRPLATPPPSPAPDQWPFEDREPDLEPDYDGGRRWLRIALVVAVAIAVVVAMFYAFNAGRGNDSPSGSPAPGSSTSPSPSDTSSTPPATTPTGTPITIVGAADFDPEGNPPRENPDEVSRAYDGNPATGWHTLTYRGSPSLGGIKSGVGLIVDLGSDQPVSSVQLALGRTPTDLQVWATAPGVTDAPTELADTHLLKTVTGAGTSAVVPFAPAVRTRFLVIWLTKLPAFAKGYRGEIDEITVRK
ncbi:MAG: serine/threonine protein kinase [Marmoricola sp.]|nr:serine/threonine protein kinase [Marmoricola sp.]